MGRLLGSYADEEELDRPDLNKCPDCNCFFPGDNCPLCGKECPENMRAGNRPAVKKKKKKASYSRTRFVEWYHSWWFIVLMLVVFPIAGIILLATSPHKKWTKILFISLSVAYMLFSSFGVGPLISKVSSLLDNPVNTKLSQSEYISACVTVDPEEFYRTAGHYDGEFVSMTVKVIEKAWNYSDYNNKSTYYLCQGEDGGEYYIAIRDCLLADKQNLINGDVITIYGEADGFCEVYDANGNLHDVPCINVAYLKTK